MCSSDTYGSGCGQLCSCTPCHHIYGCTLSTLSTVGEKQGLFFISNVYMETALTHTFVNHIQRYINFCYFTVILQRPIISNDIKALTKKYNESHHQKQPLYNVTLNFISLTIIISCLILLSSWTINIAHGNRNAMQQIVLLLTVG